MEQEELQKALLERNEKDYNTLIESIKTVEQAINNAYKIAHYNEIYEFIDTLFDDDYIYTAKKLKKHITLLLKTNLNIIEIVWDSWLSYSHPERYNFFDWDDLFDIIKYAWEQKLYELFLDKWIEEHKKEAYENMQPPCFNEWWDNEAEELAGE